MVDNKPGWERNVVVERLEPGARRREGRETRRADGSSRTGWVLSHAGCEHRTRHAAAGRSRLALHTPPLSPSSAWCPSEPLPRPAAAVSRLQVPGGSQPWCPALSPYRADHPRPRPDPSLGEIFRGVPEAARIFVFVASWVSSLFGNSRGSDAWKRSECGKRERKPKLTDGIQAT